MYSVTALQSLTGFVFGIQQTPVNPPTTADRHPVLMVSLCSYPGSLKWTCISMSPGITILPDASIVFNSGCSPSAKPSVLISTILPSFIKISMMPSKFPGSITLPPLITVNIMHTSGHRTKKYTDSYIVDCPILAPCPANIAAHFYKSDSV